MHYLLYFCPTFLIINKEKFMYRIYTLLFACITLLTACSEESRNKEKEEKEDLVAKELLQGTWIDDMTEAPLFKVKGDTIYYVDENIHPTTFKIIKDTLKTYGQQTARYHIKKQGEYIFWIQSAMGEILHLSKAEESIDSLLDIQENKNSELIQKVIEKDDVVLFNNTRYRGYVYINPTDIKVVQPMITEEGLEGENVYYDNIIHICVYEGINRIFGRDMKKQDFEHLIPQDYFQRAILSDMEFIGVNANGIQYQATLCIPNGASCYLINISIAKDGDITYELTQ